MTKVCVSCLLKEAANKDESKETQKEAETALLALSTVIYRGKGKILHLNELKEIIKFNQKHSNLTRLAYWSVWKILFRMFSLDINMEGMIAKELHFAREATREVEDLSKDAVHRRAMMIEDLLKGGSIDVFLAEIQQQTLKDDFT
eukprot:MONOS_6916.1-p1 / transcript=MONOS_6916.1 / gene=MONOS_6916 / organism=Monocercomonoides_exilis_PA203 / gene_product=unspecified product / transcript_product=unspecified product / location=Mono_scaffold00227:187-907(-) / protein_length=144 / sequence_SO=supercontig / SO=protein_coding / is_pseudo=false